MVKKQVVFERKRMFFNYRRVFWLSVAMALFVLCPFDVSGFSTDVWMHFVRIQEWMKASFPMQETFYGYCRICLCVAVDVLVRV